MHSHRFTLMAIGATLAVVLSLPTGVDVQTAHASPTATATNPGDDFAVVDPALASEPQIELEGEILVTVAEPPLGGGGVHDDLTSVSVITASGDMIGVSGDVPAAVKSGDAFAGVVAVPAVLVDRLPVDSAAIVDSSTADRPVAATSEAAADVLDVAVSEAVELPIASATVTPGAVAAAGTAALHTLAIVVINPAGVAASTASDAVLGILAAQSTGFWSSASNGLLPGFALEGSIVRAGSATACNANAGARWNEAAAMLGYPSAAAYQAAAPNGVARHLMVVLPAGCQAASGVGIGSVGRDLHTGGVTQVVLGVGVDRQVMTHELGHNLSLGHSNLDFCDTAGCGEYEYWDVYDVMGISLVGADPGVTALNVRHQLALGFTTVAPANVYSLGSGTTTTTAAVTIGRTNGGATPRAIAIIDPLSGERYFVEYRAGESPSSYSSGTTFTVDAGRRVKTGPGVRLLRDNGDGGSSVITTQDSAGVNRVTASIGRPMQNSSGSVRIVVDSMSDIAGAAIRIELTRPAAVPKPVYRFWSPKNQTHFFTMNGDEANSIIANYPSSIWTFEGERFRAFDTPVAGTVPLYRFWSPKLSGHFFTINEWEKNSVINDYDDFTWSFEGIAYYVYPADYSATATVPVARFWSPTNQHHFYTASAEETAVVRGYPAAIWTFEGYNYRVPVG